MPAAAQTLPDAALYRLMIWLSQAYPVGAFSYSSGIEWAVEAGDIADVATLRAWLEAMLTEGSGTRAGIFFALETTTLGRAFVEVTQAAWPCEALKRLQGLWTGPIAYPVAVGAACAGHAIPLAPALHAFLTAVAANWVSAGVRLIPLGHTDSQRLLHALEPAIAAVAGRVLVAEIGDLGSATFRADLASIKHETQYTRLFRS